MAMASELINYTVKSEDLGLRDESWDTRVSFQPIDVGADNCIEPMPSVKPCQHCVEQGAWLLPNRKNLHSECPQCFEAFGVLPGPLNTIKREIHLVLPVSTPLSEQLEQGMSILNKLEMIWLTGIPAILDAPAPSTYKISVVLVIYNVVNGCDCW
jgi:hypothetical protein